MAGFAEGIVVDENEREKILGRDAWVSLRAISLIRCPCVVVLQAPRLFRSTLIHRKNYGKTYYLVFKFITS